MLGIYAVLAVATIGVFKPVPQGFVPAQDKQYLIGFAPLPDGATFDRTEEVIRRMNGIVRKQPNVESAIAFPGALDQRLHEPLELPHRDADLPRQLVREPLQPVRAHVLGAGAGRCGVPHPHRRHRCA